MGRRNDRPLDQLLGHVAGSSIVKEASHQAALIRAAEALRAIFASQAECPRVLVTAGWDADPVVMEVEQISELVDQTVPEIRDRLDDILRLLRDRLREPATTPEPATTGATA